MPEHPLPLIPPERLDDLLRSAFGHAGQKCSAASRVFVDASIADEFTDRLVARAEEQMD